MQTAGFNSPLETYLVLPEAELRGSEFWWRLWNRKAPADRWSGGNCSGRRYLRVRLVEAGGEEACRETFEV